MYIDRQRLRVNEPGDMRIEPLRLGNGRYPALVIDNFYRDPDDVREMALALDYLPPLTGKHPGYVARISLSMESMLSFLHARFADFYYPTLESLQQQAHPWAFFRYEPAGSRSPRPVSRAPHVDDGLLSGVLYLNLPDQCRGGTSFYRHVETGAEAVFPCSLVSGSSPHGNVDEQVVAKMKALGALDAFRRWSQGHDAGEADYAIFHDDILNTPGSKDFITGDAGGWEMTRRIEMKYNRLVLFPGFLIHSSCYRREWAGEDPGSWRLTQNFFLSWPEKAR
jgi:hypothetical protein